MARLNFGLRQAICRCSRCPNGRSWPHNHPHPGGCRLIDFLPACHALDRLGGLRNTNIIVPLALRRNFVSNSKILGLALASMIFGISGVAVADKSMDKGLVEKSRSPYQEYSESANCTQGNFSNFECLINFSVVPAMSRLEITDVSCDITTGGALFKLHSEVVNSDGSIPIIVTLVPKLIELGVYASNNTVFEFANSGQHFRASADIHNSGVSFMGCHISGSLVKLG